MARRRKKGLGSMRIRGIVALLCVLAVIGAGVYFARKRLQGASASAQPVYATAPVTRGTLVADVTGFGPLNANFQNSLSAPAQGTVTKVFVQPGDLVHAGEVLAILANPSLADKVQADKVKLQQDLQGLAQALGVPASQALAAAQNTNIPVHAPQSGRLEVLKSSLGDNVTAGDELAEIVDDAQVVMDLPLVPYDAQSTVVGDKVDVHFTQFAGDVQGEVTQLAANPVPAGSLNGGSSSGTSSGGQSGQLVYPAVITLPNPGLLTPGLSGQVTIHTAKGDLVDPQPGSITGYGTSTVVNSPLTGTVTALDVAQGAWVNKGQVLLTLGGPTAATSVASLETQVASDQTTLQQDQQTEANLTVTANLAGTVGYLNLQQGQTVNPGQYLGVVFNDSSMNLNIQVDELQVANVHSGQAVQITTPGLPGKVFTGKVVSVSTMGQNQNGLATFSVLINVSNTSQLKPGMTADARIVVATAQNALTVPVEAVLQQGAQAVVEALQNGRPTVVPVGVGLVNSQYAQITSGLTVGETVITGMAGQSLPALTTVPGGSRSSAGGKGATASPAPVRAPVPVKGGTTGVAVPARKG